jgi:hypothetical protein
LYLTALAVPQTTLALTDRLAVRIYVTHSGRIIKLHTEDNHLSQIITTFSTGLTALNGLTAQVQNLAVGTSGTDFAINSTSATHTFNLPTASAANRGALSSADWSTFNGKLSANITSVQNGDNLEYNGSQWVNSGIKYTIELMDALTVDFYAPYALKISSVSNVLNAPTITILDDGSSYTVGGGATIAIGSKITVTASIASVVNLNIIKA